MIQAECTIDLDDKRRIWIVVNADEEPNAILLTGLAQAAAAAATQAYERAIGQGPGEPGTTELREQDEPPRGPNRIRTFGEGDD